VHLESRYLREAPLVAGRYSIIFGNRGGANHQVALSHRNPALGQVGPQRGMYPRHSEIEGDYRKLCQQSLDEGLAPVALGRRPCAMKAV